MAEGQWVIQEIHQRGSSLLLRVPANQGGKLDAGQYFQVYAPGYGEPVAVPLFLAGDNQTWRELTGEFPAYWNPGVQLNWRGPLGRSFKMPLKARKIALVPGTGLDLALLPLIAQALQRDAAVVWGSRQVPNDLPASVEVLPPEILTEIYHWADYLALIVSPDQLDNLPTQLGMVADVNLACRVEVLVHTVMACGGVAECGVCAVKSRRGCRLACKDGPVFDLTELDLGW